MSCSRRHPIAADGDDRSLRRLLTAGTSGKSIIGIVAILRDADFGRGRKMPAARIDAGLPDRAVRNDFASLSRP